MLVDMRTGWKQVFQRIFFISSGFAKNLGLLILEPKSGEGWVGKMGEYHFVSFKVLSLERPDEAAK